MQTASNAAAQFASRAERSKVDASAAIRIGLRRGAVEVTDLSLTGVKIKTLDPLEPGTSLWLKLPMLEALELRVAWYRHFEAGCEFVRPLHPAVASVVTKAAQA